MLILFVRQRFASAQAKPPVPFAEIASESPLKATRKVSLAPAPAPPINRVEMLLPEVLDEGITEAKKAGVNIFAARTLLTASNLYAKIDRNRSIEVLADSINCINRIEAPDFSGEPSLEKKPERRGRAGRYQGEYLIWFYMPGHDPESAFREMAKIDFDNAFSLSSTLTDKFQRAMSTLAVTETCLGHRSSRKPRI